METEPYITTIEDLDKFLEEMETEVTPPVTPKKSNKVCHLYVSKNFITNRKCDSQDLKYYNILINLILQPMKKSRKKIAAMYKPNW